MKRECCVCEAKIKDYRTAKEMRRLLRKSVHSEHLVETLIKIFLSKDENIKTAKICEVCWKGLSLAMEGLVL